MATNRLYLSTQVLQETFVTLTRKVGAPMNDTLADLNNISQWPVFLVDVAAILEAGQLAGTAQISFWDALLLVAANRQGVDLLYTEDLNHGQVIHGVLIHNPFLTPRKSS